MAGSHESNPNIKIATSSKKSKSKTGKSGHSRSGKSGKSHEHHEQQAHSGQSGPQQEHSKKKGKKRVQFSEEPSSKRQRVEEYDDPRIYRDGPLEAISSKFETVKPYFNTGMYLDLNKIDELGFPHLRPFLEKYMPWLGINQEYNINVLRVFCESLTGKVKHKKVDGKEQIRRVTFTATVRGKPSGSLGRTSTT